ncbi:MAG: hypothetical protein A4E20_01340 [Nitrospira sp. SG-bin2]|uniref:hypothetical protein n=1 Tax=Nitrospira cf. moscoviensis SBR1015 TaxID=96242 RepID=UPI000A0A554C|nr:hypothetical protein [Nitrospira cf. moscoviensis SBR1015]OQW34848.1 MAG: hypothetical protein A4E20_01340 [Nitrospira sp. SG-bin2]
MEWVLTIILYTTTGIGKHEPVHLTGATRYSSLDACAGAGVTFAEWLTQDFTRVEWHCSKQNQRT